MSLLRHPRRGDHKLIFALGIGLSVFAASATETDNFFLPLEPDFADLGEFLETLHTRVIEEGVREVNARIDRAIKGHDSAARVRELTSSHRPETVAKAVARQFGNPLSEVPRIQRPLRGEWGRETFPNRLPIYDNSSLVSRGHFPLDPRILGALAASGTVKAFGVYLGTDKLLHFHQVGYDYYKRYRGLIQRGTRPEEASRNVVHHFSEGTFLAEKTFFGTIVTGTYSNGDMAANYAGLKFFLNLTEKVVFQGEEREPLVVRCGVFWRVNDHVRSGAGWLRVFVSDHWNEALNPSLYDWTMRPRVRKVLESRAEHILSFYVQKDGRPNDPAYFEKLAEKLSTYSGESYGHSGQPAKLMNIGNTCFPDSQRRKPAG